MDGIINKSLNEGNIYFFITINFKGNIKKNSEIKKKIKELEILTNQIELISWYNIIPEFNKNGNFHIHLILTVRSLPGFNDVLGNNIKYFLINNYETDTKLDVCWNFLDIKKCWRYLYKEFKQEKEKINGKIKKNKLNPIFKERKIKKK